MKTSGNEPITGFMDEPQGCVVGGLTKREYFAAMALQGMLSNNHGFTTDTGITSTGIDQKARFCTLMADALIEALNK